MARPWHLEPYGITPGFMEAVLADEDVKQHYLPRPRPGINDGDGSVDGGDRDEPAPEWMRAVDRYLDEAGIAYTLD